VGGRRIYLARYSRLQVLLLWEQGGWSFCPVLLLDADESIVAKIGEAELFTWHDQPLVSLRVYYQGMGALQESHFLGLVDGRLTHLEQQPFGDSRETKEIEISHRGGGFCRASLVWENLAWSKAQPAKQGVLRVTYAVSGSSIVVAEVGLITGGPSDGCDPHYELRRP
jgi:hypothetical protein